MHRRAVLTATTGWLLFPAETGGAMVCPEKTRLQDAFAVAIAHDARIVKALHSATGVAFDNALKDAASSRQKAEVARLAVEDHRTTHGC